MIWPETALEEPYWENTIESNPKILRIRAWLAQHPGVALLTGITTINSYPSKETASETARYRDDLGYYDVFNTGAYFATATAPVDFYHKSRLVPGVEKIPPVLTSVISHIDLGGTVGSVGSQAERTVYRPRPRPRPCAWPRLSATSPSTATSSPNTRTTAPRCWACSPTTPGGTTRPATGSF